MADDVFTMPDPVPPRSAASGEPPPIEGRASDVFTLSDPPPRDDAEAPRPIPPAAPAPTTAYVLAARDVDADGAAIARDLKHKGYQPVILFGNAFSGKTSLLLSLLATIKTETRLDAGLFPLEPLLARDTLYGRYQAEQARALFERKTQEFIQGTAPAKTTIDLPFFVPVSLRPRTAAPIDFAFMESNGEWYRPSHGNDQLYPTLRAQIEDFVASYQGGIIFIHLLPYTQQAVRSARVDTANDAEQVRDAGLAVNGAIHAYERVRTDKRHDVHLMLVTKWDAHEQGRDRLDVLGEDDPDRVEAFARDRYDQVLTSLRGMGLDRSQVLLNSYCAGLINERGVLALARDNELREVVLRYPINLWRFLYQTAARNKGSPLDSPFPSGPRKRWWRRALDGLI